MALHPFVLFGRSHLMAMALTLVVSAVLVAIARWQRTADAPIRYGLAALLIGDWVWWYWIAWQHDWLTLGDALPMNLCDWATLATIVALLAPRQRAYELAYFWALGGTLQGMITPDTPYDFPEVRFLNFFVYHGGIIASVLYLTFGTGLRPLLRSIPRVIAWLVVRISRHGSDRGPRARHQLRISARQGARPDAVRLHAAMAVVHPRAHRPRLRIGGDLLPAMGSRRPAADKLGGAR